LPIFFVKGATLLVYKEGIGVIKKGSQVDDDGIASRGDEPTLQIDNCVSPRREGRKNKKKTIGIIVLVVVLLGGLAAAWWFFWRPQTAEDTVGQGSTSTIDNHAALSPEMQRFLHPTTGETWLATPKKLSKQGLYSNPDGGTETMVDDVTGEEFEYEYPEIDYYEVGARDGRTIILSHVNEMHGTYELFERTVDGVVSVIAHPTHDVGSDFEYPEASRYQKDVTVDKVTRYDSLSLPTSITLDDGTRLLRPDWVPIGRLVGGAGQSVVGESRREVQKIGANVIYRTETSFADTKLSNIGYSIQTPAHTVYDLIYEPLPLKNSELGWLDAPKVADKEQEYIKPIARGCGIGDRVTRSDTFTMDQLELFKTSPDGKKVYLLKDTDNLLWTQTYDEFKAYIESDPENKYKSITKQQFIAQNAILVYQDAHKEFLVYVKNDLAPMGGCGKPVVYLYPATTTRVNVKVGADVKVSEPLYNPLTGWNAVARPDGRLTVDGLPYDSLFWEGPGIGQYPAITSGTIVPRAKAVATIRTHLAQQGFNQKEINDFVEYWHDKLPEKPYIRLTWLTTEQMDRLAPLSISPKPDTVIRTFLDFSGYDYPIKLPGQTFTAPERRGFTVTEWGGLSPYKLY